MVSKVVIHLLDRALIDQQTVLANGGNFIVTPKEIAKEQIIANIEVAKLF